MSPSQQSSDSASGLNLPSTVQALAIAQTGDIDVLELMTLPFPEVEPGHIIVKVCPLSLISYGHIDISVEIYLNLHQIVLNSLLNQIEYLGVNFIDTYFRKGLYPLAHFPATLGEEAAGVIIRLPTDPIVLADPDYQRWGYASERKASAVVAPDIEAAAILVDTP